MGYRKSGFRPTLRLMALFAAVMISLALWMLLYASFTVMAWIWFGCLVVLALVAMLFYESGDFRKASWPLTVLAYALWPVTLVGALLYLATSCATNGTAGAREQAKTLAAPADRNA